MNILSDYMWTRRNFLRNVGCSVPTVRLLLNATTAPAQSEQEERDSFDSGKFTTLDLDAYFTAMPSEFCSREQAKKMDIDTGWPDVHASGRQTFRGIPFRLADKDRQKCWLILSTRIESGHTDAVEIRLNQKANSVCLAQFCNWDVNETPPKGRDVFETVGQRLAEFAYVYEDDHEEVLLIRRRYEVNAPSVEWGHYSFLSLSQNVQVARGLTEPLANGRDWGDLQCGVKDNSYLYPLLWISALPNPYPERMIKSLRFQATSEDPLVLCGLTLFHGKGNPLRYERLSTYQIFLPEPVGDEVNRWKVDTDLGVITRTWFAPRFEAEKWLTAPDAGLGRDAKIDRDARYFYVDLTANSEATLWLRDTKLNASYAFDLCGAQSGEELKPRNSAPSGPRVQIVESQKVWLHGQVLDRATQRPTPVRLAFRSPQGRYIPPYGHRTEINDGWFQDYGADLKLGGDSFAYVDGTFQVELPVGPVYLEMTKGFEYEPVRRRLEIRSGQRELNLEIGRLADLRSEGWITADTHVHFLPPTTALLEASAEGLNLVNLLAAQWGDLFTNVGDITNEPLLSRDRDTMVWVGSENRQHILGHIALLGPTAPVFPMSAAGDAGDEAYIGDPLWNSLADWADRCRENSGLAVAAHFPYPTGEIAADVALGKIDAVEIWPTASHFNRLRFLDWYHYLNSGYRLPAVGGTDKMGARVSVGANRAYAYIGKEEFTFANWAKAVRSGNTFVTSGPLLNFKADGHTPGQEIILGAGGGTIEIQANAKSFVPFHQLEIVMNGEVVALREAPAGTRELSLNDKIRAAKPGWIAARCSSNLGTVGKFPVKAHTSPIYLVLPGQELFSAGTVSYMLALIDGAQAYVENLAVRPDQERWMRVRKTFEDARARLHQRLHDHGIPH